MKEKGFTLIEMIVVMAVFLLIIGVAVTIFISIFQRQADILSEEKILNQVSYVEEYMSKALRMAKFDTAGTCMKDANGVAGYMYFLTRPDIAAGYYQGIKFINQSDGDACTEYYLDSSSGKRVLYEVRSGGDPVALTSPDLQINYIKLAINGVPATTGNFPGSSGFYGASESQSAQPELTIALSVQIQGNQQEPIKIIQTTISARNLNAPK